MSLRIERFNEENQSWKVVRELTPDDGPATIANINEDGTDELFMVRCLKDGGSVVVRIKSPDVISSGRTRRMIVSSVTDPSDKIHLDSETAPFEIEVVNNKNPHKRKLRFSHQK